MIGVYDCWIFEASLIERGVLDKGRVQARLVPINLLQGAGSDEGDVCGCKSNGGAIAVMHLFQTLMPVAAEQMEVVGQRRSSVEFWAWDLGKGVEECIVGAA